MQAYRPTDDLPGETIALKYDRAAFTASKSTGVLLLHHMNMRGDRAEVLVAKPLLSVIGANKGKPGSYFNLEAQGFVPQEAVTIAVGGRTVLTRKADADGRVPFVLFFATNAAPRSYTITASSVAQAAQSAQAQVTIDTTAAVAAAPRQQHAAGGQRAADNLSPTCKTVASPIATASAGAPDRSVGCACFFMDKVL